MDSTSILDESALEPEAYAKDLKKMSPVIV